MEPRKAEIMLASLPADFWPLVTSYLSAMDLISLLKASNKLMRHNLLNRGGVTSFQLVHSPLPERRHSALLERSNLTLDTTPVVPTLVEIPRVSPIWSFLPLKNLFPKLTSFHCAVGADKAFMRRILLSDLPSSLTHLDWAGTLSLYDYTVDPVWRLSSSPHETLPNLRHLSILFDFSLTLPDAFLGTLPINLVSLRLISKNVNNFFSATKPLPPGLTSLALVPYLPHIPRHECLDNLSPQMMSILPTSLTDLQLPCHQFDTCQRLFHRFELKRLHLYRVTHPARSFLPPSLTHLHLEVHESCTPAYLPTTELTSGLRSLYLRKGSGPVMPCPPSVTHIKIFGCEESSWRLISAKGHSFSQFAKNLVQLDWPFKCLNEDLLIHIPPTVTSVSAWDINLSGASLPGDLQSLTSAAELAKHFFLFPRPYSLRLIKDHPCTTYQITSIPLSLETLTLPRHGQSVASLPRSLTDLTHVSINNEEIAHLPSTITKLHFYQPTLAPGIDMASLTKRLPKLRHLSSMRLCPLGFHIGKLILVFPANRRPSHNVPDVPREVPLRILHFPDDAIAYLKDHLYPDITFEELEYDCKDVILQQSSLECSELTFNGPYAIPRELDNTRFLDGLRLLDLTFGRFVLRGDTPKDTLDWILPNLPASLSELRLGGLYASAALRPLPTLGLGVIPTTLETLRLTFLEMPHRDWSLSPDIPSELPCLDIWITHSAYYGNPLAALKKHFIKIGSTKRITQTTEFWVGYCRKSASNRDYEEEETWPWCSIM